MTQQFPVVAAPPTVPVGNKSPVTAVVISLVGVVFMLLVIGIVWFGITGGPSGDVGNWHGTVAYPQDLGESERHSAEKVGDTVYFSTQSEDSETWITAVDAQTGAKKWQLDEPLPVAGDYDMSHVVAGDGVILVRKDVSTRDQPAYAVDADTGKTHELDTDDRVSYSLIAGQLVREQSVGKMEVLDAKGDVKWDAEGEHSTNLNPIAAGDSKDYLGAYDSNEAPTADHILTSDYTGNVTVYEKSSGKVVEEKSEVLEPGTHPVLAVDGIMYTLTQDPEPAIITYDLDDDFAKLDTWEVGDEQRYSTMVPCGEKFMCASGYGYESGDGATVGVVDPEEGIVFETPDDVGSSTGVVAVAGKTLGYSYMDNVGQPMTQLFDAEFEEIGEPIEGWYSAVDEKTFATVDTKKDEPVRENEVQGYEVSIVDAKDGRVSILGTYPAYRGCEIYGQKLACSTKEGYRLWDYR